MVMDQRTHWTTRSRAIVALTLSACAAALASIVATSASVASAQKEAPFIDGRVVASGIPGASAVSPIGMFLPDSPINSNPALAVLTQPGRVLDPTRIVVGSRSNFGAPRANADQFEGSFLSIDPRGAELAVPPHFASAGNQASVLEGAIQMYSAQSPNWLNGIYNPAAVTADQPGVANPLGMSINNAFGRLWPANAPYGLEGPGSSSITDPDGRPLKGAPNPMTGGVYFGDLTGRQPAQVIPGPRSARRSSAARQTAAAVRFSPSSWRTAVSSRSTRGRHWTGSPHRALCSRSRIAPGPTMIRVIPNAACFRGWA